MTKIFKKLEKNCENLYKFEVLASVCSSLAMGGSNGVGNSRMGVGNSAVGVGGNSGGVNSGGGVFNL